MNVVLVGGGGREHALAWRIAQSPTLSRLVCVAANPGFDRLAPRNGAPVDVRPADSIDAIVAVAVDTRADLVVVGPEVPLEQGIADALARVGVPCFGPTAAAARIETSKAFAKDVMRAAGVPTAAALVVDTADAAAIAAGLERCRRGRVVVKVDGLAAGKGVFVCPTPEEALAGFEIARTAFGPAGGVLVLEDLMTGPEVSLFALCDGTRAVAMLSAQDHKRIGDGDTGPNTGGMGAIAPSPLVDRAAGDALCAAFHAPVLAELARRGIPFRGLLYAGLMMPPDGPRALEFNARFGDPETQAIAALWDEDVLPWLAGAASGRLPEGRPRFAAGAACCVVVAAGGYPDRAEVGVAVPEGTPPKGGQVFYAGARAGADGRIRTSGGRVLGVTGVGADAMAARESAYAVIGTWRFPGSQIRRDIGGAPAIPA